MLGEPVEGRTKYNMAKRRAHKLKQELGHVYSQWTIRVDCIAMLLVVSNEAEDMALYRPQPTRYLQN